MRRVEESRRILLYPEEKVIVLENVKKVRGKRILRSLIVWGENCLSTSVIVTQCSLSVVNLVKKPRSVNVS